MSLKTFRESTATVSHPIENIKGKTGKRNQNENSEVEENYNQNEKFTKKGSTVVLK